MRKGAGSLQIWVLDEPLSGCVTWSQPVPLPGPQSPQLDSEKGNQMIGPHLAPPGRMESMGTGTSQA